MIKVGDKVKFLNDVGGGTVTRIINKKLVHVENEDGFELPTLINELIVIGGEPESNKNEVKKEEPVSFITEKKQVSEPKLIDGKNNPEFYMAFVPQDEKNPVGGEIEVWLVNDSNFKILFNYSHYSNSVFKSVLSGTLESNSVRPLESFVQWDLTEFPEFCFQIVYFTEEATELYQPVVKKIKVNPVKFYKEKSFSNTSFFQKKALMLAISNSIMAVEIDKLSKSDLEKVISQKEKSIVKPQKSAPRKRDGDLVEVDLHISELVDNTTGLSNREILEIQTERFKSEMELAIKEKVKRIVFIHGVGQGTLKTEVLKELNTKYKKYYFQDASFKEYGYGATMVILRKG